MAITVQKNNGASSNFLTFSSQPPLLRNGNLPSDLPPKPTHFYRQSHSEHRKLPFSANFFNFLKIFFYRIGCVFFSFIFFH
jgi:hypothetical protein